MRVVLEVSEQPAARSRTMRTYSKTLANRNILTVTVCTPTDERGGCTPAFSITAEERNPRFKGDRGFVSSGPADMYPEVLQHFPELRDVVALHLSDAEGRPMHHEANGWYWLAGACGGLGETYHGGSGSSGKSIAECREILSRHLRISAAVTADMINTTITIARQESPEAARANFRVWLEDLAPRWRAEAEAAQAKYGTEV